MVELDPYRTPDNADVAAEGKISPPTRNEGSKVFSLFCLSLGASYLSAFIVSQLAVARILRGIGESNEILEFFESVSWIGVIGSHFCWLPNIVSCFVIACCLSRYSVRRFRAGLVMVLIAIGLGAGSGLILNWVVYGFGIGFVFGVAA